MRVQENGGREKAIGITAIASAGSSIDGHQVRNSGRQDPRTVGGGDPKVKAPAVGILAKFSGIGRAEPPDADRTKRLEARLEALEQVVAALSKQVTTIAATLKSMLESMIVNDGTVTKPVTEPVTEPVTKSVTQSVTKVVVTKPTKGGRPPKGERPMTPAERMRVLRARQKTDERPD